MKNIKWMLEDRINEVFEEIQEERNIESGDIEPLDEMALCVLTEKLADLIELIISKQQ